MSLLLRRLKKSFREPDGNELPIINIEHFEIKSGEQVALIGSSGGGKTTLLHLISGIHTPDSGEVIIDQVNIAGLGEPARDRFRAMKIGYIFQTFNLLPAFTALENVLLGMSFSGKKANREEAIALLDEVGLKHRLSHRPSKLSVGEQQRVAIARALANKPKLLLADEPTASIDSRNQDNVLRMIRDVCNEHKVSLLLVTHSEEVAGQYGRVETLSDFNKPEELLAASKM
ncbi:Lipoprotein-releasing system ATP-binding protein LolD [Polystyrenella longa]|uniref:Lipoprotein-releasing system ATP-binding protein LolD n=1 Tax=Polystyrenella longa TaxID=2528007 RepID=A0A518CQK4_9PLAN|nr:ABC transporter ATP-binding protein [Polystyrenella longa]QDU81508.1 Lipoprotein-releasing system ATP-binding protein LolD [Polystyrenella longa]